VRVGIDYLPATSHWPGVGRYARELVRALVALEDRPDVRLFDVGRAPRDVDVRALGLPFGDPRVRRVTRNWSRRTLPFLARIGLDGARILGSVDVFHHVHAPGPPVRRARQVMALAELPPRGSLAEHTLADRARAMDALVVFCTDWRLRAADQLGVPLARIHVTSVGCEHWRRTLAEIPPPDDPPVVLVLGATRPERHPLAVLRGFERLRERIPARLLFVGRTGGAEAEFRAALERSPHVAHVARVTEPREADLPGLVARASVLVHLDPQAGTPVTPLEALRMGLPVVASRNPCFAEALQDVATLVDAAEVVREPDLLATALEKAIASRSDGLAEAVRAAHARAWSWERCARETLAVWHAVARA